MLRTDSVCRRYICVFMCVYRLCKQASVGGFSSLIYLRKDCRADGRERAECAYDGQNLCLLRLD